MRLPVNHVLPLVLITALASCGDGGPRPEKLRTPVANGPAADYPMVLGDPFQLGGVTYTPEDKLNYDAVGYALVGAQGGAGVSVAHKTLPLPSYVEVTSLESGKTILARVERRGPMEGDGLVELSPGAAAQLGLAGEAKPAVRVRRVNPPEQERAALRAGQHAPDRMDTPKGLLEALNRKLAAGAPLAAIPGRATVSPAATIADVRPVAIPPKVRPAPKSRVAEAPHAAASPAPTAARGSLVVQVAALSTQSRANGLATDLGGRTSSAGRLWRVRLGPFASNAEAQAALAKAKAAGYSDARIQRAD